MTIKKQKVIIADDEEHVREFLASIMENFHFEVVGKATNGLEAETLFREKRPDIMLLDINMPVKTGLETIESLSQEFDNVLVIMLTVVADEHSVKKCIQAGASYFIRKDTPMPKIVALIQDAVSKFDHKKKLNQSKFGLKKSADD